MSLAENIHPCPVSTLATKLQTDASYASYTANGVNGKGVNQPSEAEYVFFLNAQHILMFFGTFV